MRKLVMAALMFGVVHGAQAADLPDFAPVLRGAFPEGLSSSRVNWQGYYIGGQAGYGTSDMKFAGSNDNIALNLMPYSPIQTLTLVPELGKVSPTGSGFGGFAGYNSQWDDVVIGLEASFIHGSFSGASTPVPFRYVDANGQVAINSLSTAAVAIKDYGSLRARAGYAVGSFLPYLFGGVALGRADIDRTVSLRGNFDPLVTTQSSLKDHFIYGYSVGVGVDIMLVAGLFLRAEYEYQRFTSAVDLNVSTGRAGIGYKF